MKISVAIITLNEEEKLPDCLKSLDFADEIVLVDSGSRDNTKTIAESFGAKVHYRTFDNFANQKNAAIELCEGEWIFLIDADERVTQKLAEEIKNAAASENEFVAYQITRLNHIFGGKIRHGASGSDQPVRLIKNGHARYQGLVHEQIKAEGPVGQIDAELEHITYQTLDEYYRKFNLFSTLDAQEMLRKKPKKPGIAIMLIRPWAEFFIYYIMKLGFLDGWRGFLYQVISSYYVFIKYAKAREIYENEQS